MNIHIENQDNDEELLGTLKSLLAQITDDDGSLTFDDLSQIHVTIKTLLDGDVSVSSAADLSESDSEDERRKRRKRTESKASKDDLKTSKKKRKYSSDYKRSSRGGKKRKSPGEYEESSGKNAIESNLTEVEAGEIDDVYDDDFIVEKEFEDLLMNNHNNAHSIY